MCQKTFRGDRYRRKPKHAYLSSPFRFAEAQALPGHAVTGPVKRTCQNRPVHQGCRSSKRYQRAPALCVPVRVRARPECTSHCQTPWPRRRQRCLYHRRRLGFGIHHPTRSRLRLIERLPGPRLRGPALSRLRQTRQATMVRPQPATPCALTGQPTEARFPSPHTHEI